MSSLWTGYLPRYVHPTLMQRHIARPLPEYVWTGKKLFQVVGKVFENVELRKIDFP